MHLGKHLCFRGGREKEGKRERNRGKMHPEWDHCLPAVMHAGKAGQHRAFVTLKAFQAGHLRQLTSRSLLGCWVPVPTGCAPSFSLFPTICCCKFPLPRSTVSVHGRKQEGEKPNPNLHHRGDGKDSACALVLLPAGSCGCFRSTPGCQRVPGTPRPRLCWGRMGNAAPRTQWDPLPLYGRGRRHIPG